MLISALIQELEAVKKKDGDLEVWIQWPECPLELDVIIRHDGVRSVLLREDE